VAGCVAASAAPATALAGSCVATGGTEEVFSCQTETFCPGDSTCTPADTMVMPGCRPAAITASLPSAVATSTGCSFTVMVLRSSSQTAEPCPSWRSALVGILITCAPAWLRACGATVMVAPSGGCAPGSSETFTGYVRVAGSALAATSRMRPMSEPLLAHWRTATWVPARSAATLSSGTENTTSRGPSAAMRTTGVPAVTTWPTSASTAVITPETSATSVV
jgi:hypothetical protein